MRSRRVHPLVLAVALATALLVTGCGAAVGADGAAPAEPVFDPLVPTTHVDAGSDPPLAGADCAAIGAAVARLERAQVDTGTSPADELRLMLDESAEALADLAAAAPPDVQADVRRLGDAYGALDASLESIEYDLDGLLADPAAARNWATELQSSALADLGPTAARVGEWVAATCG